MLFSSYLRKLFCPSFHIARHHCRLSFRCSGVKRSARKWRMDLRFASARDLEIIFVTSTTPYVCFYSETSHCRVHNLAARSFDLQSLRGLPGRCRPYSPYMSTFSCPQLPRVSDGTLRMIHLASHTECGPACTFHVDDQASLKLA